METKSDKFRRLGEARVNKLLKQIELLSNLSNRSIYEYNEEQVTEIFRMIKNELRNAENQFKNSSSSRRIIL